ncbi:FimV/HubP family polar landmark protein [Marinobacter fonticola]|uniref:FimV/HubP family polar landmark protein n=1 Tax=Marinobacter fonticola TaxID=2603215 RepID=UPI0011E6EB5E|nr:FimV/HubP family polar landmark protein [Marinobacter fonticola]
MKVRKLAVALALVGGLGSSVANALGLGEVELQSYLNEPLDAEIELRNAGGVTPNEVFVNLAPPAVFERVGVSRDFFLTNLQFEVITAPNGQLVINVTTRQPVREPYLNFLLEVTWPSGKLLREYSMLLDPPVYAAERGEAAPTQAPSTSTSRSSSGGNQPSERASAPRSTQSSGSGQTGRTFGPTDASDTLWGIALQVRPDASYTPQQVMLALQDLNPDAFMNNNINRLMRGQVLRIPTAQQINARSVDQAYQEVTAQNRASERPATTVDATGQQPAAAQQGQAQPQDELRLVAGDESTSAEDGASSGGAEGVAGGSEGSTAVVMEQLDQSRRENEELNSRVEDLQAQLATMQRLVELKNSQLAELQAESAQAPADNQASTAGDEGTEPSEPSAEGSDSAIDEAADGESDTVTAAGSDGEGASDEAAQVNETNARTLEEGQPVGEEDGATGAEVGATGAEDGATGTEGDAGVAGGDAATTEGDTGVTEAPDEQDAQSEMAEQPMSAESSSDEQQATGEQARGDAPEPAVEQPAPAEPATTQESEPTQPAADRGFFGNLIEELKTNRLYQLVAGGGAVLLLLLLALVARRNANREKAFYDQLNAESESDFDNESIDLSGEGSQSASGEEKDALAEADAYIAYGRHDQAAETLESAISREPSRSDLRLKLLAVYAESEDRAAFEKQYGELEALDDEAAMVEAQALRERLEEAESMPSIDDLESQLRSTSATSEVDSAPESDPYSFDQTFANLDSESATREDEDFFGRTSEASSAREAEDTANDFGLDDAELNDLELDDQALAQDDLGDAGQKNIDEKSADAPIEYDISELDLDEENIESKDVDDPEAQIEAFESATESEELDINFDLDEEPEDEFESSELAEDDFGSLELDDAFLNEESDQLEPTQADGRATSDDELPSLDEEPELATDDAGNLDESFLDDLDAELEKVASETADETEPSESETDTLDELELDVSDEDLALMEEVSEGSRDTASIDEQADDDIPELDEELGLEDSLESQDEDEIPTAEESLDSSDAGQVDKPKDAAPGATEFDEAALDDEDDFDFLSGTDEAATKLDLARAYIEMGDADGARDILEEVAIEGDEGQKVEAQDLLKNLA